MDQSIDPQHQCKFFAAPTEIRQVIYAHLIPDRIHLSLCKNEIRLSACVQRDKDDNPDCMYMQLDGADILSDSHLKDAVYARRVQSSWGPHWRCEEAAYHMEEDCKTNYSETAMVLLRLCKRMFIDVMQAVADTVAIELTDFHMLEILVSRSYPDVLAFGQSCTSNLLGFVLPHLKVLSITLKLPLEVYEELANASESASNKSSLISAWMALPLAFKHLSKLRRLRIWLDHEEPCSWSMVNERAVISPLASLRNNPELDMVINLPKLHPKWQTPDRHFTKHSPPLPIAIHRRYRQRYHGVEQEDGSFRVQHESDFPVLYIFTEILDMTMEEVEELERSKWEGGEDVMQELRDVERNIEPQNYCGVV